MAEALLRNVMRNARLALQKPADYDVRAEIMWAGTLSHNDITGDRSQGDWASHQLEHELGGMFDIAHGAGPCSDLGQLGPLCAQNKTPAVSHNWQLTY